MDLGYSQKCVENVSKTILKLNVKIVKLCGIYAQTNQRYDLHIFTLDLNPGFNKKIPFNKFFIR